MDPLPPQSPVERERYETWLTTTLRDVFGGQRWIVATEVDQSGANLAEALQRSYGADVLAVGARSGTGPISASVPLVSLDLPPAGSISDGAASAERALADPPPSVLAAVDRWDPDGTAPVIGSPLIARDTLLGRRVFGARRRSWAALEDKVAIEPVWRAAGLETAPSEVVEATDRGGLLAAHRRLRTSAGTVWAGDNHSGFHGGAEGTHWVPDLDAAAEQADRLERYGQVRIMPFIEGVPCSIHGLVTDRERRPAVFRPCELMMLRDRAHRRFFYARASTFWDPDGPDRAAMVDAARLVGVELVRRHDYRGFFTLDGVMGVDGFVPTEVNTRIGAALPSRPATLAGDEISLLLLGAAVIEGALDDLNPVDFERWLVPILDQRRQASAIIEVDRLPPEPRTAQVIGSPDTDVTLVEAGGPATTSTATAGALATVRWGPGPAGGVVRIDDIAGVETGPPTAPRLVRWLGVIDRHWGLDLPPLEAAVPAR